jgi:hypothetical protein
VAPPDATDAYGRLDDRLNALTGLPHYPNPLDYLSIVGLVVLAAAAPAWLASRTLLRASGIEHPRDDGFVHRTSRFRVVFLPLMYAAAPLVGADYLARQLPKFFGGALTVIPAAGRALGIAASGPGPSAGPSDTAMAGPHAVVAAKLVVVIVGALASAVLAARTFAVELRPALRSPAPAATGAVGFIATAGALIAWLYVLIEAAP